MAKIALQNKSVVYNLLFKAAAETLQAIAADPKHLGVEIGFLAVLHTWGQNLLHHPHVHCVVPGGGLSPDHSRWISCPPHFFLPVRVLSRLFRGKFLAYLRQAYQRGELEFHGSLAHLRLPQQFSQQVAAAYRIEWVVYAKPPFGGPEQVLKYLARYTHRVAISNDRLLQLEDGQVTFRWKNYAAGGCQQTMTLEATEFLRRFVLHVLPTGFVRIRNFGFCANCHRQSRLELCRRLLAAAAPSPTIPAEPTTEPSAANDEEPTKKRHRCPHCGGEMVITETWPRVTVRQYFTHHSFDTS